MLFVWMKEHDGFSLLSSPVVCIVVDCDNGWYILFLVHSRGLTFHRIYVCWFSVWYVLRPVVGPTNEKYKTEVQKRSKFKKVQKSLKSSKSLKFQKFKSSKVQKFKSSKDRKVPKFKKFKKFIKVHKSS